ncbi:MAG: SDR family NAD(P)-dependent oxidoreductase [Candidatus Paceibacterota bacterium]
MQKVGIVTGASSGLGKIMAKMLAQKGHIVYVVARRENLLQDLKNECTGLGGEIRVIAGDLTEAGFRSSLIDQVKEEAGRIDFLFNNAGYGSLIYLEKQEEADISKMYEVNCTAYQDLTKKVIPIMKDQGEGRIICICSIAGLNAPALFSTYGATKYAVLGFMKPLRYELAKTGIHLGLVFPPRMRTDFWTTALKCYDISDEERQKTADILTKNTADPEKIAQGAVKNLETKKFMILPHPMSWMAYNMLRHMYWFYDFFMNKFMLRQAIPLLREYKVKANYTQDL